MKIGMHIGKVMEVENPTRAEGRLRSYLRINVEVDATKPLFGRLLVKKQ